MAIDEKPEVADLYGLPLDEFTTGRNDLAARLKDEGDSGAASRVKSLKKPSTSAWIVNQLVRTRPLDMKRLLQAGEKVEKSQRDLLAGKTTDFDQARQDERAAVRTLRDAASDLLPTVSAPILERVAQTLEAVRSTEGRALLKEGRLTEDVALGGFEVLTGFTAGEASGTAKPPDRKVEGLVEKRKTLRDEVKSAAAEVKKLEREERTAEAAAKKAARAADSARKRAASLAADLQTVEDALAKARAGD